MSEERERMTTDAGRLVGDNQNSLRVGPRDPIVFEEFLPVTEKEEHMKDCFGTIYPDLEHFQFGRPMIGKVFQIRVDSLGSGHRDRKLDIDEAAWRDCRRCEDFGNCYEFSNAKLQMQLVLREL